MCGINGVFSFNDHKEVNCNLIAQMNKSIQHRGPDDNGISVFNGDENFEIFSSGYHISSEAGQKVFLLVLGISD